MQKPSSAAKHACCSPRDNIGEQTIRLLFDEPNDLRRIRLRFRSQKLSERSSSPCVGQVAQQVLLKRSFDSSGTLIPKARPWR